MSADLDLLNEGIRQFNATGAFDPEMLERDVEWVTLLERYEGLDGVERWTETIHDLLGRVEIVLVEHRRVGERLVTYGLLRGTGRSSGISSELPFGAIWTFSESGKLARVDSFPSYEEAIAAAES